MNLNVVRTSTCCRKKDVSKVTLELGIQTEKSKKNKVLTNLSRYVNTNLGQKMAVLILISRHYVLGKLFVHRYILITKHCILKIGEKLAGLL